MTKTNDLFMPRTTVRRDSAPYQEALRLAKQHQHRDDGDETTNPRQPFWIEAEARAVIGRHLIVLEDGGDAAGGCWACTCPVAEHPDGEQRWFCPAANGMICDTCCEHDMDDGTTGLRAWGDGPCIGCEHFNEHRFHARPARVERCNKCDGQIAAGTWAYHVYRRGRWMPEGVDTLSVDDCDGVDIDLFPFLPPPSDNGWEWQHRVCGFLLEDVMSSDRRTDGDRPDETA